MIEIEESTPAETVTFILVPGFWLGGWAWDAVTERLRDEGFVVDAVTLPGVEPEVSADEQVTLDDQIAAVVAAVRRADDRAILVGHSGAGTIVSGAADIAHEQIEQLVFVDSGPMPDGFVASPDLPDDVDALDLPPWDELERNGSSLAGLDADDLGRFRDRAVPHPAAPTREPLRLHDDARHQLPVTLVCASYSSEQVREMAAAGHPWFQELSRFDSVQLVDLETGHWPMWSRPDDLAAELRTIATRAAR